jgi:hypothetical protein
MRAEEWQHEKNKYYDNRKKLPTHHTLMGKAERVHSALKEI